MANNKTSVLLIVLCVLSLVSVFFTSLFDLYLMLLEGVGKETFRQAYSSISMPNVNFEEVYSFAVAMINNSWIHLLFNIVELVGVVMLFIRRWVGLHFYIASQIGFSYVAFVTFGFGGALEFIFMSLLWIIIYIIAVRKAKAIEAEG